MAQTSNFYTHMLRNLSVLRDVQRIILEARYKKQHTIIFRDENGERWMLKRIPLRQQKQDAPNHLYT